MMHSERDPVVGFGRGLGHLSPADRAEVERFRDFLSDVWALNHGRLHPGVFGERWDRYMRGEPDAATEAGPALGREPDAAT